MNMYLNIRKPYPILKIQFYQVLHGYVLYGIILHGTVIWCSFTDLMFDYISIL